MTYFFSCDGGSGWGFLLFFFVGSNSGTYVVFVLL